MGSEDVYKRQEDKAKVLLDDKKRMLDEHNSVPDADKRVSGVSKTKTVPAGTKTVLAGNRPVSAENKTKNKTVSEGHKRGAEQGYGNLCSRIPRVLSWILSVCTNTCGPCRHRRRSARDSGSSR